MFHAMAERKVREMFESLSKGVYEPALQGLAPGFEHVFAGDHALGGVRHTQDGLRAWFERLYRLFPNLDFEVRSVVVSGPAWDLVVVAEWIDRATPAGGGIYMNRGVHVVRLSWGRLAGIHAYLDTQVLASALQAMADKGIEEAVASPIVDVPEVVDARHPSRRGSAFGATPSYATGASRVGAVAIGALAIGALATGAVAIGALAIGRVAIGSLVLGRARIARLEIDALIVRNPSDAPRRAARPSIRPPR